MANLSERLSDMAEFLADDSQSYFLAQSVAKEHAKDLATILDRLTVEGLAGVMRELVREQSEGEWDDAMINADADKFTRRLLTYITGESHD